MTNVAPPEARGIWLSGGHCSGAEAPGPGLFSYRLSANMPMVTPAAHAIPTSSGQRGERWPT